MSFPDRMGVVRNAIAVSTWSIVLKEVRDAINQCVRRRHQGAIGFVNGQSPMLSDFRHRCSWLTGGRRARDYPNNGICVCERFEIRGRPECVHDQ